jgi:PIN domain nuclease of toxin-antitoxin system
VRYLLDTQAFIWLDSKRERLTPAVAAICSDPAHQLILSIASVWEMQIKIKLGKLTLPTPLAQTIAEQQKVNALQLLPVELPHVLALDALGDHHKDPFDRLLIAQAQVEKLALITSDPLFARYPVTVVW